MSFREKSLWVMLLGLAGASAFYSYNVASVNQVLQPDIDWRAMRVLPPMVGLFIAAVVVLVVFSVVGHAVMAIVDRRTEADERDRLIELKGERVGGFVLAAGVFFSLWLAVVSTGNFAFTQLLLGFWVLAQASDYAVQLWLHRRGR